MAKSIIGRFDPSTAERVMNDLLRRGFSRSLIRHFPKGEGDLYEALVREGIPDDEATYYVDGLRQGGALVSVQAEEDQVDEAVKIMNRYARAGSNDAYELEPLPVPLYRDSDGIMRVVGSRVPLDVLVDDYRDGASAEDLSASYPTLRLEDIHAVLSYYLRHREALQPYLLEQKVQAEVKRREVLRRWPQAGLRERLLARQR